MSDHDAPAGDPAPARAARRPADCLVGGGQMGARLRAADWSATPLGPIAGWPQSLCTALSMILEAPLGMLVAWGPEARVFYNDRCTPLLGPAHPQALGEPAAAVFAGDWAAIAPRLEAARRGTPAAADDEPLPPEGAGPRESAWLTASLSPIRDESGGVGGVLAVLVEPAGRASGEHERRLAALREELARVTALVDATLATVPVGLAFYDRDLRFVRVNATLAGWNGWDAERLVGRTLAEVASPAAYAWLAPKLLGVLASGRIGEPIERSAPNLSEPGELRHWLMTCYPIQGTLVGVVTVDVTDEVRARDRLARTILYNDKFTAILGHDLRNPLNAILTTAELLRRRATSEEIARPAARIAASGERMVRMIEQLLDLARVRVTGGLQLSRRPVDLAAVCRGVVDELRAAFPGALLELLAEGALAGRWDGDRLAQVVSSLGANALEHGVPGAPVRMRLDGRTPNRVRVRVENEGAVPEAIQPLLFDPFRSADHRNAKARGLGLGLYLAREVVAAHGGKLTVHSTPADGTCFEVELPRPELPAAP